MESPHEILGVDADASEAEIERAYRRRVKETHPDQGGSVTEFLRVRDAYEELVDGHTEGGDPAGGAGPSAGPSRADEEPSQRRYGPSQRDERARHRGRDERRRHRRRNGRREETGTPGESDGTDEETTGTRVEYLDYDLLVDRDWELETEDLFAKAAEADLEDEGYGEFVVEDDETLLAAAERHGHEWPYSCRGGACANCAVAVLDGELSVPVNHILPEEMIERNLRLSCIGEPVSDELRVVFNVKHLPELDDLRLPPHPSS